MSRLTSERPGYHIFGVDVLNKNITTNAAALLILLFGLIFESQFSTYLVSIGMFALSGALTNWLAIHMLFEKVPFLYGSGIIPLKFEAFKSGIFDLIMGQFFNSENVKRFLEEESSTLTGVDLSLMTDHVPLDSFFDKLKEAVGESPLGGMLAMFGGTEALEPMREKFKEKMSEGLSDMAGDPALSEKIQSLVAEGLSGADFTGKIETIVKSRLDELTPELVKEIIQNMIREHLGWLVVWGGVFGGLIGFFASLVSA